MQIEHIAIENLIPYACNSRIHSDEQVAQIAGSIREFGFTNPVLVDAEGGIIAGHGRVLAARKLDLHNVPCIVLAHLTDIQKRAYVIADNKLALNSGWEVDLLRLELEELDVAGFNLELTGFVGVELTEAMFDKDTESNEGDYFDVDQTTKEQSPKATDDDYSVYELIMKHANKTLFISALNKIKSEHGFEKQEDAVMHLVKSYF